MRIVLMCLKCGLIRTPEENDHSCDVCEYCGTNATQVNFDADNFMKATQDEIHDVRERVWRKFLYNNPEFDEYTFDQRLIEERARSEEVKKRLISIPVSNTPSCPYCKSPYVEKISTGDRLLSTALFGLGSSKAGKQWHCKNCKSNF